MECTSVLRHWLIEFRSSRAIVHESSPLHGTAALLQLPPEPNARKMESATFDQNVMLLQNDTGCIAISSHAFSLHLCICYCYVIIWVKVRIMHIYAMIHFISVYWQDNILAKHLKVRLASFGIFGLLWFFLFFLVLTLVAKHEKRWSRADRVGNWLRSLSSAHAGSLADGSPQLDKLWKMSMSLAVGREVAEQDKYTKKY